MNFEAVYEDLPELDGPLKTRARFFPIVVNDAD
jgi:hypothetical protein